MPCVPKSIDIMQLCGRWTGGRQLPACESQFKTPRCALPDPERAAGQCRCTVPAKDREAHQKGTIHSPSGVNILTQGTLHLKSFQGWTLSVVPFMHAQIVKRMKQLMKEGADGKRQAKKLMDDWSLQRAEEVVLIRNADPCLPLSVTS